jgi:hypothetical protein
VARACEGLEGILIGSVILDDTQHTVPVVINVIIVTPQVTILGYGSVVGLGKERGKKRRWRT